MLEASRCISTSVQYYNVLKLSPSSNFILFSLRNSKHELPPKKTKHRLFQTSREYGNVGKQGGTIVVRVGNSDGEGNERTQDLLVEIAMLEAQKVRVAEFMNEKSDHLKEMAEQTNSELQQIADDTMKGMDEAGLKTEVLEFSLKGPVYKERLLCLEEKTTRERLQYLLRFSLQNIVHLEQHSSEKLDPCPDHQVDCQDSKFNMRNFPQLMVIKKCQIDGNQEMSDCVRSKISNQVLETVEAEVRACEEELASERAEMKIKEQQIDKFEKQSWEGRNEGLFFQTLFNPAKKWKEIPPDKRNSIQMEVDMVKKVTKRTLNSSIRRNLYLFLILVVSLALLDAIASGTAEWSKLALYAVFLVILVTQLTYETTFSSKDKYFSLRQSKTFLQQQSAYFALDEKNDYEAIWELGRGRRMFFAQRMQELR
ncbi:hypothetical protein KI387_004922 [Taxus chinensis]|uniref:Uncharacterized protein n=1 Tax=Taxus chinensis TaxID=29808 RepID=A0AA38GIU0_TAXCH|nr:hypothetical protein KI387_004922 [Taxus chinensis]